MNWIERYVSAVKNYLPAKSRNDVGEELTSLLEEELNAMEESFGAPLPEEKVKEWIATKGHPAMTAAGYQERRSLISENAFPLYKHVVKYYLIILAAITGVLAAIQILHSGDFTLIRSLLQFAYYFAEKGLIGIASITLVFHFWENYLQARDHFKNWKPENLPNITSKWQSVSYVESVMSILFTLAFLAWVNGVLPAFVLNLNAGAHGNADFSIHWSSNFQSYLLPINVIGLLCIGLYVHQLFRPYWSVATLVINMLLGAAVVQVLISLLGQFPMVEVTTQGSELADKYLNLSGGLNHAMRMIFIVAAGITIYEIIRDIRRIFILSRG